MTILFKRSREQDGDVEALAMANSLALLSRVGATVGPGRVFPCKTCNREFPSFQALGGHRASHKKLRLMAVEGGLLRSQTPDKPKTHECSICGLDFAIGQALGGHMRRHRSGSTADGKTEPSLEKSVGGEKKDELDLSLRLAPMWMVT